ncbi:MAG: signal peptidase I [Spirochaetales bacterium]|nr:signal peptidase I [Spirochaetales bacterium]
MTANRRDFKHFGKARHPARRIIRTVILFCTTFFVIYLLITSFFLASYSVGSMAMEPTLSIGDRIISSPLVFGPTIPFTTYQIRKIRQPERGELIICKPVFYSAASVERVLSPFVAFFTLRMVSIGHDEEWETTHLIKRVIGLPGETIRMEDFIAFIKPAHEDGFFSEIELTEKKYAITYSPTPAGWQAQFPYSGNYSEITLGPDEYFVLGDNRSGSHDSRHWGPVPSDYVSGKVLLRYWPLRKFGAP